MLGFFKKNISYITRKFEKEKLLVKDEKFRFERELEKKSIKNAVNYAYKNMSKATYFNDWKELMEFSSSHFDSGYIFEFGVAKGKSLNFLSKLTKNTVYGFDSFTGFPPGSEYTGWEKGNKSFNFGGNLPSVNSNVKLIKGYIEDTLPNFLEENDVKNIDFIHIDCDLYDVTKLILNLLKDNMDGTFIQFDEYYGQWAMDLHEMKAFEEFMYENKNLVFEFKGFTWRQVLVKVNKRR